ncbi:Alpha/Beta hydrolase protein [Ilyonectria sp. MPI-CAGE-AT-0026]|nr:Alpha/Beta hydrolase protein [Ilyonectria sp. MPI-CAGE-AT-0026]
MRCTIWVPKDPPMTPLPLVVRWHGGGLVTGERDDEPYFPTWVINLAALHSTIIGSFDYRLLPESTGLDTLSDLQDSYLWLHRSMQTHLQTDTSTMIEADLARILITGESAGGYCAIQSALHWNRALPHPKAVIAHYPMLDLKDAYYQKAGPKYIWNKESPSGGDQFLLGHLISMHPGTIITRREIPDNATYDLFTQVWESGRFLEFLGTDTSLYPVEVLDSVAEEKRKTCPVWIFHGTKDTVVPFQGSQTFFDKAKSLKLLEKWDLVFTKIDGEDHCFDSMQESLEVKWAAEGREWLGKYWP